MSRLQNDFCFTVSTSLMNFGWFFQIVWQLLSCRDTVAAKHPEGLPSTIWIQLSELLCTVVLSCSLKRHETVSCVGLCLGGLSCGVESRGIWGLLAFSGLEDIISFLTALCLSWIGVARKQSSWEALWRLWETLNLKKSSVRHNGTYWWVIWRKHFINLLVT